MVPMSKLNLKSAAEVDALAEGGAVLGQILRQLALSVKPGVTGAKLDELARRLIKQAGGEPSFLNYNQFPAALCVSPDDQVVHGFPTLEPLKEGQIVGLDLGLYYKGLYTDSAVTVPVGKIGPEKTALLDVTKAALKAGISAAKPGQKISDISRAIQTTAEAAGFNVVRDLVGHGVGFAVHEEPNVPNFVDAETLKDDVALVPGLVLALEPMVNLGQAAVQFEDDGWTVRAKDGTPSAHFEHTIVITEGNAQVLTR